MNNVGVSGLVFEFKYRLTLIFHGTYLTSGRVFIYLDFVYETLPDITCQQSFFFIIINRSAEINILMRMNK